MIRRLRRTRAFIRQTTTAILFLSMPQLGSTEPTTPPSPGIERYPFECQPGSGDLRGQIADYNKIVGPTVAPWVLVFSEATPSDVKRRRDVVRFAESHSVPRLVIDGRNSDWLWTAHPLSVSGDRAVIAKTYADLARRQSSRSSLRKDTPPAGDLTPYVFHGSIYPDILGGEIYAAWAAYHSADEQQLRSALSRLEIGRQALSALVVRSEDRPAEKTDNAGREAALGLLNLHLGMLKYREGSSPSAAAEAAEDFQKAAESFKANCTPRFHALATLGHLAANSVVNVPTSEDMLQASRALAALPPHEHLPAHCVGTNQFHYILRRYLESGENMFTENQEYLKATNNAVMGICL